MSEERTLLSPPATTAATATVMAQRMRAAGTTLMARKVIVPVDDCTPQHGVEIFGARAGVMR